MLHQRKCLSNINLIIGFPNTTDVLRMLWPVSVVVLYLMTIMLLKTQHCVSPIYYSGYVKKEMKVKRS